MSTTATAISLCSLVVFFVLGALFFFPWSTGSLGAIYPEKRLELLRDHPVIGWLWFASGLIAVFLPALTAISSQSRDHIVFLSLCCALVTSFCVGRIFPAVETHAKWAAHALLLLLVAYIAYRRAG